MYKTSEFTNKARFVLMYTDERVLSFDSDQRNIEIYNKRYMPFGLRHICDALELRDWLRHRATPLTRKNVDFMYAMCNVPRTERGQIETIMNFGGASINDNFWVKEYNSNVSWEDVVRYKNYDNRMFGLFSLTGSRSHATSPNRYSPEVTLQGNWSKCLVKRNGSWILLKADDRTDEQEVAAFANMIGVPTVEYWNEEYEGVDCSACKIMTTEYVQWISAEEFGPEEAKNLFPEQYHQMRTFDYIVGNKDRHNLNWSVVVDRELNPISLSLLYDFNLSLMDSHKEIPEKIDSHVVAKALEVASRNLNLPNRLFYLPRARLLAKHLGIK